MARQQNHTELAAQFYAAIWNDLQRYKANLDRLADGVYVEDEKTGRIYTTPPDRAANIYLIDRVLGRPVDNSTPASSKVHVEYVDDPDNPTPEASPGPEDGGGGSEAV